MKPFAKNKTDNMHILVDSTALKIFVEGEGEWEMALLQNYT